MLNKINYSMPAYRVNFKADTGVTAKEVKSCKFNQISWTDIKRLATDPANKEQDEMFETMRVHVLHKGKLIQPYDNEDKKSREFIADALSDINDKEKRSKIIVAARGDLEIILDDY